MKKSIFCALLFCAFSVFGHAQDSTEIVTIEGPTEYGWSMTVGFDNMTAYNWRGMRLSYHPFSYNIMPNIAFDYSTEKFNFNIGAYDMEECRRTFDADGFVNRYAELGAWASVSFYGVKLDAEVYGLDKAMWNKKLVDDHGGIVFDLGLSYTLDVLDWFQPSLSWYTIMAGDDMDELRPNREGKNAFSSYMQLDLPFYVGDATIGATVGCNPFYSPYYCNYENKFVVSNLGANVGYTFAFDNGIEIPLSIAAGYNFGYKNAPEEINYEMDGIDTKGWYFGVTASFYFTHMFKNLRR